MASGMVGSSLKHLRDLFGGGTAVGLGDGELLRRYAASDDGPAFAALVARHGPMVAATCSAVLRDHHDAEDAFQATFLVLARKAASLRDGDSLGGWLHRVAYRAAVQRNVEVKRRRRHESESPAMDLPDTSRVGLDFDLSAILHEEIDRLPESHRVPVVLCDLEGLTYEQAAGRLHWTVPTLYHRLARGRRRLRDRLVRRGVTAAGAGVALELSHASASAAVPSAWAQAAVASATGGPIPTAVAALGHQLIRSLIMGRLKIASAIVLAMAAIGSAGVITWGVRWSHAPSPASRELTVAGAATRVDKPKPAAESVEREGLDLPNVPPPRRGALRIAKLKHAGDWSIAPRAIPNLMEALHKPPFRFDVRLQQAEVFPRDPALIYYALLYIQGRAAPSFTDEDVDALRRHLEQGGTLFADAACGSPAFDAALRRLAAELFPDRKLEPIPRDDEL